MCVSDNSHQIIRQRKRGDGKERGKITNNGAIKKINTPSYHQVVEPIYTKSIDRYKNFPQINKIEFLISKWLKEFDYNF